MKQVKGFTLIELLVVVAIIGILSAVAGPMYTDYMRKSKRAEGKNLLMQVASRQEQYYLNNSTYTDDMTELGFADDPITTENGHYKVDVKAATVSCAISNCFALEAIPQGDQTNDICQTLTFDSDGAKGSTAPATDVQNCW